MKHRYLFTLEVTPLRVGKVYDDLPLHLTIMSRFWSGLSPNELADIACPLFNRTGPLDLVFGETIELGPKKLIVRVVQSSSDLKRLHYGLHELLDLVNVTYEYPQFVGENHKPHVTKREGVYFNAGDKRIAQAAYLIEVVDKKRVVCSKFDLNIKP